MAVFRMSVKASEDVVVGLSLHVGPLGPSGMRLGCGGVAGMSLSWGLVARTGIAACIVTGAGAAWACCAKMMAMNAICQVNC
jgi:hypothetical protein